jgi:hypothetical protein
MNDNRLSEFIKSPDSVKEDDIFYLKALVKKYPFFPIAHVLLLTAYHKFDKENFDLQLRESALCIPDRKKLFNLIYYVPSLSHPAEPQHIEQPEINTPVSVNSKEEPIEFQFDNTKAEITINEPVNTNLSGTDFKSDLLDFDNNLHVESEISGNEKLFTLEETENQEDNSKNGSFSLIDKFIESIPVFTPNKLDLNEQREDISLSSLEEDEDLISETLATIFESQKLYDKAISIYEKLILKFPEKSTYFASRINDLKTKL